MATGPTGDQSGSMVDSVIHSAVMAACYGSYPAFVPIWSLLTPAWLIHGRRCRSGRAINESAIRRRDNIASAVEYGRQLIEQPAKSALSS